MSMIFVDGRVFATGASHRGMGNYLYHLLEILSVNNGYEVILLMPTDSRREITDTLPVSQLPINFNDKLFHRNIQDLIYTYKPMVYIDATPFLGPLTQNFLGTKTIAVNYDLIPLLYPSYYLGNDQVFNEYKNGIHRTISADGIIYISETSKSDFQNFFPNNKANVVIRPVGEVLITKKTKTKRPTNVLASVGMHPSKNPYRLSKSLVQLAIKYPDVQFSIVVSSKDWEAEFRKLTIGADLKIYSELSEEKYSELLSRSQIYIHPSVEEGFGIPLLNAINADSAVVAALIPINKEICESDSMYGFDAQSETGIFEAASRAIEDLKKMNLKKAIAVHYKENDLKSFVSEVIETELSLNVAWLGPLPPQNCGIADYSAGILKQIPNDVSIHYFSDQVLDEKLYFRENIKTYPLSFLSERKSYLPKNTRDIYQLAAAPWFKEYIQDLLHWKGKNAPTVIMHDHYFGFGLYELFKDNFSYFLENFIEPEHDRKLKQEIVELHKSGSAEALAALLESRPLLKWVGCLSDKILSHANPPDPVLNVELLPMPSEAPLTLNSLMSTSRRTERSWLNVGCFGRIARNKFLEESILAIYKLNENGLRATLLVVGEPVDPLYFAELQKLVVRLGLTNVVNFTGLVAPELYWFYLNKMDVLLSLRDTTRGGLSAVLINGVYLGKSIVASKIPEHMSEFLPYMHLVENEKLVDDIVTALTKIELKLSDTESNQYSTAKFFERLLN